MNDLANLALFVGICIVIYLIYKMFDPSSNVEGMDTNTTKLAETNGVAGGAAALSVAIKDAAVKMQDELLISKYRQEYESIILNADDLLNNLMLKTILNIKPDSEGLVALAASRLSVLQQAKTALNSTMEFIDGN